jgi:hypothetical protein
MVKKAVAFIKEQGPDEAYAEFSKKAGSFHDRDLYITVLDLDGKLLAHGQREDFDANDPKRTSSPRDQFGKRDRRGPSPEN